MITIVITSYKEPKTIGRAIKAFLDQDLPKFELIVSAPDKETLNEARKFQYKNKNVKLIKDLGKGKPSALNNIFKIAKGNILILSDGDVYVSKNSVKNLLKHIDNKKIGAVTGRPVSINEKRTMLGFWAHLLTTGFHYERIHEQKNNRNILASGYLYAIKKEFVKKIPENILADDAFISFSIIQKGKKIVYEPESEVYVKYPTNIQDWIKQKTRTAGRFYQLNKYFHISKLSSFKDEIVPGMKTLKEVKNLNQLIFFIILIIMRFYIWFRIFFDFRLWKKPFKDAWERIESTK